MAATILSGRQFDLFGIQGPVADVAAQGMARHCPRTAHPGAYVLASLVLVHASAAILHRVIANDGVLDSMLPAPRRRSGIPIQRIPEL
jgi:cytochrome b561